MTKDPLPNLVLRQVCEAYTQQSEGPIEEAVQQQKKHIMDLLLPLSSRLHALTKAEMEFETAEHYISTQAKQTTTLIQEEFKRLWNILQEEEQRRIRAVCEEEEEKRKRLMDKMAAVKKEKTAVSKTLAEIEKKLQDLPKNQPPDASLLRQYKSLVERAQCCPLEKEDPHLGPGSLIDQAKHLANLSFNIWSNMKQSVQYTPVILDPNSATTDLTLSADLTSVSFQASPLFPQNPERLRSCYWSVLGFDPMISGTHSWTVQVSQNKYWELGVATRSEKMAGVLSEVWKIGFCRDEYEAGTLTKRATVLSLPKCPEKVWVLLDVEKGELSFYDFDSVLLIYSFTHTFTGNKVFPYFFTGDFDSPLKILPQKVRVTVK